MNTPNSALEEQELLGGLKANNQLAFSTLYDRYAAILLGIITKIISDKTEAITLLETTFTRIREQIDEFRPGKQPLFLWLFQIARTTAQEALKERQKAKAVSIQLTGDGKVIRPDWTQNRSKAGIEPAEPQWKTFIEAILFKNCTPEEAATSVGLPVETVRQQLRFAMQQLRNTPKG